MTRRIVFTGGSGKAGKQVVPWLKARGYDILNLDLKPLDCAGANTLITDVTDSGQVLNALTMHHAFNAVNDTITTKEPTAEFLETYVPQIPLKREMAGNEAPLSNAKIRSVLGFREEHDWRKYV